MSSTEDDNAVLCRSQDVGLKQSEAEVESVVESVVRGEERASGGGDNEESGEASGGGNQDEAGVKVEQEDLGILFFDVSVCSGLILLSDFNGCFFGVVPFFYLLVVWLIWFRS